MRLEREAEFFWRCGLDFFGGDWWMGRAIEGEDVGPFEAGHFEGWSEMGRGEIGIFFEEGGEELAEVAEGVGFGGALGEIRAGEVLEALGSEDGRGGRENRRGNSRSRGTNIGGCRFRCDRSW